jgi:class 3 adenylate cyclase
MPNLNQIYALKEQFLNLNNADQKVKDYLEKSEARDVIQKAFDSTNLNENYRETRAFSLLTESLNPAKPELIKYFDEGREEDVALLFIDITSFSKTISGWTNARIKRYLDDYYKIIIPIIYENGGEIEKLMGDGIIALFGKPFLDLPNPQHVYKAEKCAEEAIRKFYDTDRNVKVAIHTGKVNYYKVPGEHYGEYTIIGQPITDLYRLESVSKPNAINFFDGSNYDHLGWHYSIFDDTTVVCWGFESGKLQGVDFTKVKYLRMMDLT